MNRLVTSSTSKVLVTEWGPHVKCILKSTEQMKAHFTQEEMETMRSSAFPTQSCSEKMQNKQSNTATISM